MRKAGVFLATCGWIGHAPAAPGTAGSLAGLLLYGCARTLGGERGEFWLLAAVLAAGVWSSSVGERHFGKTDPGAVVIDEVAGMLITLAGLQVTWTEAIVGFVAFRFFDVVKPFPARRAERLRAGWGVMADDVIAGLYAHLALRFFVWASSPVTVS